MSFGFVYVMFNQSMPGTYKVGMTDRSPSQRAKELSASTSCPLPFEVLFFSEVIDARVVEADLHLELMEFRVSASREFFKIDSLGWLLRLFQEIAGRAFLTDLGADMINEENLMVLALAGGSQQ